MPQEFHVIRCYSCETFQVHIVKKSNKWCCKMCGEKQSLKKVYSQGSSKDCRIHVQSLNEKRMLNNINEHHIELDEQASNSDNVDRIENLYNPEEKLENHKSKWSEYLTNEEEEPDINYSNEQYTFERPQKRKFCREQFDNNKKQKNYKPDVQTELEDYNKTINIKKMNEKSINEIKLDSNSDKKGNVKIPAGKCKSKWSNYLINEDIDTNSDDDDKTINLTTTTTNELSLNKINFEKPQCSLFETKNDNCNDIIEANSKNIFNTTNLKMLDDILDI